MRNPCHSRSTIDNEKLSLRGGYRSISNKLSFRIYVIRSRKVLTVSTRLVFAVTICTGFLVIFASIWFMTQCRENFRKMNALIPPQANFCTNLGMQALFACCVLLFTIFGFGCIGRRMTGHAILIISGVAIFQGATTATFYQCRAMTNKDILKAVNSTLESCRIGKGAIPFTTVALGGADEGSKTYLFPLEATKTTSSSMDDVNKNGVPKEYVVVSTTTTYPTIKHLPKHNPIPPTVAVQDNQHDDDIIKGVNRLDERWSNSSSNLLNYVRDDKMVDDEYNKAGVRPKTTGVIIGTESIDHVSKRKTEKKENDSLNADRRPRLVSILQSKKQAIKCEEQSKYFNLFAKTHQKNEIDTCLTVCQTYKAYCINGDTVTGGSLMWIHGSSPPKPARSSTSSPSTTTSLSSSSSSSAETHSNRKFKDEFYKQAFTCGETIASHVRQFCEYDNQIFIPMSIGTPVFYMLMSFCFIYLAYCDRQLKLKDNGELLEQHESFTETTPSCSSFSSNASRPKVRPCPRSHSEQSLEPKETPRQPTNYSLWSPFRRASRRERGAIPSPTDLEASSQWDGHPPRQLEEDTSIQISLQSCSAKTSDTFLSID